MCISSDIAKFGIRCRPPSVEKSVSVACFCVVCHLSGCFGFFLGSSACCSGRQTAIFTKCMCIFLFVLSLPFNVSLKILLQSFQIVTRFQCALLTLSLPHPHGLLLADAYTSRAMPGGAILSSTAYPVSVCPFILSLFVLYFTSHTTLLPPP